MTRLAIGLCAQSGQTRRAWRAASSRRATAIVEMALVTPLLVMFLLGIIEFSWLFNVKQCLTAASRTGARMASLPGATQAETQLEVDSFMTAMGLAQARYPYTVNITMPTHAVPFSSVVISMRYQDVTLVGSFFSWLNIGNLTGQTSFTSETQ